jgi:hypothetical protein
MLSKLRGLRPSRHAAAAIALVLLIGGIVVIGVAVHAQRSAPQPSKRAAGSLVDLPTTTSMPRRAATTPTASAPTTTVPAVHALAPSVPTAITVPSIGVHSSLVQLDQNADGSVQVPTSFHVAGWYRRSVTPGQIGPTIILGHVDSKAGPGIFYRLGALHPGDRVTVNRADGSVVTFEITGVREYLKTQFPTLAVYANTPVPTIRLVTCGGTFDRATGHYLSNIVAYGRVV